MAVVQEKISAGNSTSSASMKLSDHHSCESFAIHDEGSLNVFDVTFAHEFTLRCQYNVKDLFTEAYPSSISYRAYCKTNNCVTNSPIRLGSSIASTKPWQT